MSFELSGKAKEKHWEVLSSELDVGDRMRNEEFGMRNELNRNAERGVRSLVQDNSELRTKNSELGKAGNSEL
jgi:hypothetical protein